MKKLVFFLIATTLYIIGLALIFLDTSLGYVSEQECIGFAIFLLGLTILLGGMALNFAD